MPLTGSQLEQTHPSRVLFGRTVDKCRCRGEQRNHMVERLDPQSESCGRCLAIGRCFASLIHIYVRI